MALCVPRSYRGNDNRSMCLDRKTAIQDLLEVLSDANTVVVSGESGVGKSALAVSELTAAANANPEGLQVLCMNLRHIHRLVMELETALGQQLSILLGELGAPQRILVIDGADAIVEDRNDIFRHLVDAAKRADVKVIAVTSSDSKEVVRETLKRQLLATRPQNMSCQCLMIRRLTRLRRHSRN